MYIHVHGAQYRFLSCVANCLELGIIDIIPVYDALTNFRGAQRLVHN